MILSATDDIANVAVSNSGSLVSISNAGAAVDLNSFGVASASLAFSNTGSITAAGSGVIYDLEAGTISGSLINSGTISSSSPSSYAFGLVARATTGGTFTIDNTGTVTGTTGGIQLDVGGPLAVTLQNSGTIRSTGAGYAINAEANSPQDSISINNTGTIEGAVTAIFSGDAPTSITNAGLIKSDAPGGAAIQLGAGANVVTITNGSSIQGAVLNGSTSGGTFSVNAADKLVLGGAGDDTFDVSKIAQTPGQLGYALTGATYTTTTPASDTTHQYQGFSTFQKVGSGTWILTGVGTNNGAWSIDGGRLEVDGTLASSDITVNAGATLAGIGKIGDPVINAGGTLAPGTASAMGTLSIVGPLTFQSGSFYDVRLTSTGNDKTDVSGLTTLNGGTVNLSVASLSLSKRYTLLTATEGVSGTFAGATSGTSLLFTSPVLSYDAHDVYLQFAAPDFRSLATTRNLQVITSVLTAAAARDLDSPIVLALSGFTAGQDAQARAIFNGLAGEGIAAADTLALRANQLFTTTMTDQTTQWLDGAQGGGNAVTLSAPMPGFMAYAPAHAQDADMGDVEMVRRPLFATRTWHAWATGFGAGETIHGATDLGTAGQTTDLYGGAMGVDYQVNPSLLIGVAGGGSDGSFQVPGRATYGSVSGGHVGAYSLATFGAFYATTATSLSLFRNQETRMLAAFGGFGSETDRGGYDSHAVRSRLEVGRRWVTSGGALTPFLALEIADLRSGGFTEMPKVGPGALALDVPGRDTTSVPSFIGLRYDRIFALGDGMSVKPILSLAYGHDFAPERPITTDLVALQSAVFGIDGARVGRNFAQTKAGFELALTPKTSIFASFDGEFSDQSQFYGGRGGLRFVW